MIRLFIIIFSSLNIPSYLGRKEISGIWQYSQCSRCEIVRGRVIVWLVRQRSLLLFVWIAVRACDLLS